MKYVEMWGPLQRAQWQVPTKNRHEIEKQMLDMTSKRVCLRKINQNLTTFTVAGGMFFPTGIGWRMTVPFAEEKEYSLSTKVYDMTTKHQNRTPMNILISLSRSNFKLFYKKLHQQKNRQRTKVSMQNHLMGQPEVVLKLEEQDQEVPHPSSQGSDLTAKLTFQTYSKQHEPQ